MVRNVIRAVMPDAAGKISYQMPSYWKGKTLIYFAVQESHLGIYLGAETIKHFIPRLYKYKTSKGTVQFLYKNFGSEEIDLINRDCRMVCEAKQTRQAMSLHTQIINQTQTPNHYKIDISE